MTRSIYQYSDCLPSFQPISSPFLFSTPTHYSLSTPLFWCIHVLYVHVLSNDSSDIPAYLDIHHLNKTSNLSFVSVSSNLYFTLWLCNIIDGNVLVVNIEWWSEISEELVLLWLLLLHHHVHSSHVTCSHVTSHSRIHPHTHSLLVHHTIHIINKHTAS